VELDSDNVSQLSDNTIKSLIAFGGVSDLVLDEMIRRANKLEKYAPDQPRDENGQFASVDGGSSDATSSWNKLNQTTWDKAGHLTKSDLTDAEIHTLTDYTQMRYADMNDSLRFDSRELTPSLQADIDNLTMLIDRNEPLPEDTLLYRGVHNSNGHWDDLKVGDTFRDKGFISTSPIEAETTGFGSKPIQIEAPAGTWALDTFTALNGGVRESEVILQRGTKFEVMANEKEGVLRLRVLDE